jgi:prepilin-type N-terminal cleavage/methylation domain-containing protein
VLSYVQRATPLKDSAAVHVRFFELPGRQRKLVTIYKNNMGVYTVFMKATRSGYTLIELSVVLVIISLLTAGGLTLGAGMVNQAAHIDTKKILDQIDQSLRDYYTVNGRLPCPAARDLAITDTNFGREVNGGSCNSTGAITGTSYSNDVRIGMIPVRALGLSDRAASDKYGNRILYAVTRQLTDASVFGASDGAVHVLPATGAEILDDAAYFVWSAGKDHKGAPLYTTAATPTTCSGTALDAENCDNDNIFRDAPFNNGEVVANFFDDHARWVPKFHLTAAESHSDTLWAANGDANLYSVGTDTNTANTNVGIGTTAPGAKLDIDNGGDGAALLRLSSERPWQFEQSGAGNAAEMDLRSLVGGKTFNIKSVDDDSIASFYAGTTPTASRVTLVPDGGKVRVGPTTADNHLLTVSGTQNNGIKYLRTNGRDARIEVGDTTQSWSMASGWATAGDFSIIQEGVSGNRLYIKRSDGNVGIGTSDPQAELDVTGRIRANQLHTGGYATLSSLNELRNLTSGDDFILGTVGITGVSNNEIVFMNTDGNQTIPDDGISFINYGSSGPKTAMRIGGDGYVGIGTSAPETILDIKGGVTVLGLKPTQKSGAGHSYFMNMYANKSPAGKRRWVMYSASSGSGALVLRATADGGTHSKPQTLIMDPSNGNLHVGGSISSGSDRRLKKDIQVLEVDEVLGQLQALKPFSYRWKHEGEHSLPQFGFIAQDMLEIWPGLVEGEGTDEEPYGLNYNGFIAPTVLAVQVLLDRQDAMAAQIEAVKELDGEIKTLHDKMDAESTHNPSMKGNQWSMALLSLAMGFLGMLFGYRLAARKQS